MGLSIIFTGKGIWLNSDTCLSVSQSFIDYLHLTLI